MVARILSGEGVDFEGARSNRNPGPREDLRFFVISSLGEDLGGYLMAFSHFKLAGNSYIAGS
jgi:hypothetical protein